MIEARRIALQAAVDEMIGREPAGDMTAEAARRVAAMLPPGCRWVVVSSIALPPSVAIVDLPDDPCDPIARTSVGDI